MRCCVIGGAGFIGRHLCAALAASGREVLAIGRGPGPECLMPGVGYLALDAGDRASLRRVLADCDELLDLAYATVPKTSYIDPSFDLMSNLPRVVGMMEELKDLKRLRRLLVVSSGGTVYGPVERLPISEETSTAPISPYGITKLAIERYALMYHFLHGVPSIVVRPANAYGVGQLPFRGQGFVATAMGNILQNEEVVVFGEQGTVRDYVHVRDLAAGIVAALEHGVNGEIYNIGSGVGRSNLDVIELIRPLAEASGLQVRVRHEPARKFDVPANVLSFGRLLARSGWLPRVSMQEGLAEMWQDFSGRENA